MEIHLIKPKKIFQKRKTWCNKSAEHWKYSKYLPTDLTDDISECICERCLIEHEEVNLEDIHINI